MSVASFFKDNLTKSVAFCSLKRSAFSFFAIGYAIDSFNTNFRPQFVQIVIKKKDNKNLMLTSAGEGIGHV